MKIYIDDLRTPVDNTWVVVRNIQEFTELVEKTPFETIKKISFDHDLGKFAMNQFYVNVSEYEDIDYNYIHDHGEYTGKDCAKWLINYFYKLYGHPVIYPRPNFYFPECNVHSANVVGKYNIAGLLESFFRFERITEFNVTMLNIEHTADDNF